MIESIQSRILLVFAILLLCVALLNACGTSQKAIPNEIQRYSEANTSSQSNGCRSILDNYCSQLYSPNASGNLIIDRRKPIQILQGETQNQLPQVFYRYSVAKIKNKRYLPSDFLSILDKYSYFDQLNEFIHRNPIQKMTLGERLDSEHMNYVLGGIWQSAIEQTVVFRMSVKYNGFHQIPTRIMPIEYEVEQKRIRRTLISELSKVLWRDDSNWKKVTEGFNELKTSFLILFENLDIPQEVRNDWKTKIQTLNLVLPGSLPEISDEECSTTTINAYYYKYLNLITVCAGDFNSEDIILTLAHEMAHSLGLDRDLYTYLQKSKLSTSLRAIRNNICSETSEISCADWSQFKAEFEKKVVEISNYHSQMPTFNKCLKKTPDTKSITESDLDRISNKISRNRMANFASSDLFLRLIKSKLPMKNGKMQKNPNYLKPCSYYLWSKNEEPIDDEIYSLIFFAAEYKCSSEPEDLRLKSAINLTETYTTSITKAVLQAEGEFSDREELTSEGFSSPPYERFADVLGTYAVAGYLNKFGNQWERRSKYLASSSWLCQEPSLESKYPEESKIVQQFVMDSHSQTEDRKMEIFSSPIRESLKCDKDFAFTECQLPFISMGSK